MKIGRRQFQKLFGAGIATLVVGCSSNSVRIVENPKPTMATTQKLSYGNQVAKFPADITLVLAKAYTPSESGAIGRNRTSYFHVRFQRGMHHVADYGLATQQHEVVDRFIRATEYSIQYQLSSGNFDLVIPEELKDLGKPSIADQASGVAFFASSLGLGLYALETNEWFLNSSDCQYLRVRLAAIKPKLERTLSYLLEHRVYLETVDRKAPNRLLFDAVAFVTFGKILQDKTAVEVGSLFAKSAASQTDKDGGYFIEDGGFDSSYNGVATALAFRLLMMGYSEHKIDLIAREAVEWQRGRVLPTGEISTEGNTRVNPDGSGESFLGRKKDVDVGHTVEAFLLASRYMSDDAYAVLASRVVSHYQTQQ